ncbi:MAG: ABC transporter ATP-binding protein [Promethearchaeota archaeon]
MGKSEVLYHLESLQRFYTSKAEIVKAIDGIDLDIHVGDFIAILGPSGSGKTTFLNILAGLDKPTGGNLIFDNTDISTLNDSELCDIRRFDIGIVFQFFNLHPSFTAQENIEYPMMIADVPYKEREIKAADLLKQMNLYDKKDNYPIEMSGGEKQRVGIARALANDPRVLIADEPTGDLDSENAKQIIELLLDINNRGTTIVMVTHDESLLSEKMSILSLVDGKIINP